jgi:L-iditol 2-dehydrogenase
VNATKDQGPRTGTHRCAYLVAPGRVEVRDVPIPQPGPGEVLLRIDLALAGGTDRKAFARGHPQIPMPGPFGHRYAGTVVALGAGAPSFAVGQAVMGVHSAPCRSCPLCRKGREHLCPDVMREKVLGAFGQYLCIPAPVAEQNLYARPEHLPVEHALFLEPLACIVHGLELIDWRGVERVLVLGLGPMGLLFAQLLPHYTRAYLAGTGRQNLPDRLALAREVGLDPLPEPAAAEPFDCVIECTGQLDGWHQAFALAGPGGQVLLFGGVPRGTEFCADTYRLHYEEVRVLGSFHFSPRNVARARDHLLAGGLRLDALITGRVPLDGLAEALHRLDAGQGLQYVIDPWA